MINVKAYGYVAYVVRFGTVERANINRIAAGYSIPKEDAIVAIINRGIDSIGRQVKDANASKTLKQLWDEQGGG